MIKERVIAARYADAFVQHCQDTIGIEKAVSDLEQTKQIMRDNPTLKEFLAGPEIAYISKCNVIDKVINGNLSDEVKNFLELLIKHRRIENFLDIAEYAKNKYSDYGKEKVTLKSSYPLDSSLLKKIEKKLEEKFKQKFKFYTKLDKNLLGGVQVIIGNKVIDGSLRRKLDDLKEKLNSVQLN